MIYLLNLLCYTTSIWQNTFSVTFFIFFKIELRARGIVRGRSRSTQLCVGVWGTSEAIGGRAQHGSSRGVHIFLWSFSRVLNSLRRHSGVANCSMQRFEIQLSALTFRCCQPILIGFLLTWAEGERGQLRVTVGLTLVRIQNGIRLLAVWRSFALKRFERYLVIFRIRLQLILRLILEPVLRVAAHGGHAQIDSWLRGVFFNGLRRVSARLVAWGPALLHVVSRSVWFVLSAVVHRVQASD